MGEKPMFMTYALEKEEAWFKGWFDFMVQHTKKSVGEESAFDEGSDDEKNAKKNDFSLMCVTTLYQQESFPMLYIQKNKGFMRNQKMVIEMQMILRTNYEGRNHEASCLQKIASILGKPYEGVDAKTIAHFEPKSIAYKCSDKKVREVVLAYDARIVWRSPHDHQE